jgi:hypothetical protein
MKKYNRLRKWRKKIQKRANKKLYWLFKDSHNLDNIKSTEEWERDQEVLKAYFSGPHPYYCRCIWLPINQEWAMDYKAGLIENPDHLKPMMRV